MRTLKPSNLPEVEASAMLAWRQGWFQGITVGVVIGFAAALIVRMV